MLEEFAARQGFTNIVHFTDDGISGTCFDRPGFLAMMKEVEAGNVEYLCIKDMSSCNTGEFFAFKIFKRSTAAGRYMRHLISKAKLLYLSLIHI